MTHKCLGCKATFTSNRRLSAHRVKCTKYSKHASRPTLVLAPVVEATLEDPNIPEGQIIAELGDRQDVDFTVPEDVDMDVQELLTEVGDVATPALVSSGRCAFGNRV